MSVSARILQLTAVAYIAQTILQQLGGNKFTTMTGAKNFVRLKSGLQFDISGRLASNKANRVTIELVNDLYNVTYYRVRGLDFKKISSTTGIHAGNLAASFKQATGLDTHL